MYFVHFVLSHMNIYNKTNITKTSSGVLDTLGKCKLDRVIQDCIASQGLGK